MTRRLLANLGFEYELAGRPLSSVVRKHEEKFAHILRVVSGWESALPWEPGATGVLLAWGYSQRARDAAGEHAEGWPSVAVTRTVNSKTFSLEVERALGVGLPGADLARSVDELAEVATSLGGEWVAKHPFGVAGRERVAGGELTDALRARAAALLATADALVVEPLVAVTEEYSVHFDILPEGAEPAMVGATRLLTDPNGTFRGNDTRGTVPDGIVDSCVEAARMVALEGYHGPLGVDAFVGRLGEERIVRPVVELNARWTFGRLALELAARLEQPVAWYHGGPASRPPGLSPVESTGASGLYLLPDWCDPAGISGTWIELFENGRKIDGPGRVC